MPLTKVRNRLYESIKRVVFQRLRRYMKNVEYREWKSAACFFINGLSSCSPVRCQLMYDAGASKGHVAMSYVLRFAAA
jgi:hypothetical protein